MGGVGYARHYISNAIQLDENAYASLVAGMVLLTDKTTALDSPSITNHSFAQTVGVGISFYLFSFFGIDASFRYVDLGNVEIEFPAYSANVIDETTTTNATTFTMYRTINSHKINTQGTEARVGVIIAF